jgi:hypothetical protein
MHIRGPVHLKQFAVYYQNPSPGKGNRRRHDHQRLHRRREAVQDKNEKRDMVVATIDGKVVSWENNYSGAPAPTPAAAAVDDNVPAKGNSVKPGDSTGDWLRAGYYDAASQTLANLTFLNNMGGQGSGTFD